MSKHASTINEMPTYPEVSPVHEQTLGAAAVHVAERSEWHDMQATYLVQNPGQGSEHVAARLAETFYEDTQQELADTRTRLGELNDKQKDKIDPYIETLLGQDIPANAYEYSRLSDWLTKGADDEQLLDVLEKHVRLIAEQQQDPEVQTAAEEAKAHYADTVKELVREGYFDEYALDTLQKIKDTKIYIGDIWDMTLRNGYGYHIVGSDHIVVGQGTGASREQQLASIKANIQEVVPHELSHVQFGDKMPRIVIESVAEWSAMRARDGQDHPLNPHENPAGDSGVYTSERSALARALQEGTEPIDFRAVTRAYSSEGPHTWPSAELRQKMHRSWGDYYFLDTLDKAYNTHVLAIK